MTFTIKRKEFLSEKLGDLANIVFAGLVIGQLIAGQGFNYAVFGIGILGGGFVYYISLKLKK